MYYSFSEEIVWETVSNEWESLSETVKILRLRDEVLMDSYVIKDNNILEYYQELRDAGITE
jgi:hypothetical protein